VLLVHPVYVPSLGLAVVVVSFAFGFVLCRVCSDVCRRSSMDISLSSQQGSKFGTSA
jgi:hypothetical protein